MNLTQSVKIGVDNGNSNTKTTNNIFVSGVTSQSELPPLVNDYIKYKDTYYTKKTSRAVYNQDKTKDIDTFILTLFGVAMELEDRRLLGDERIPVDLALGLPPGHWVSMRKKFVRYFLQEGRDVDFEYKGRQVKLHIERINVFPQGISSVLTQSQLINKYQQVYMIDIGGYTVDYCLIERGTPDFSVCDSIEMGMILMNNKIISEVSIKYSKKINDSHIEGVLFNKPTVLPQDIKDFILQEASAHARNILSKLRELGIDLSTNPAVFLGGGSIVMKSVLENSPNVVEAEFITEITANAQAYQVLADRRK